MTHQIDINQLIEAFDLRAHVASIWGEGKRNGKVVMYRSRWRSDDDHPSFAVYADGYKDHGGSNEGGGVLDFLCKEHGWTKGEAVDFLRDQTRILPTTARRTEPRKQQDSPLSINWQQQVAERVTVECADILWSKAPRVLDYLRTARGLSDDMIRRLQFGYNPALRRIDYTDENGKQATAWLSPGITIPRRANGMIYAVRTRSRVGNFAEFLGIPDDLDRDGEPLFKYLSLSGSKPSLVPFNADALRFTPGQEIDVLIVEGEIDAATGQQYLGDQVAVITMGSASTAFPAEWYDVLKKARHVYSCMDADGAGQGATQKIAAALGDWHTAITLPDGVKDLNDAVTKNGLDVPKWWAAATAPRSASAPSGVGRPAASDQSAPGTPPVQFQIEPRYFLPYTWRRSVVMINTSGDRERPTGNLGLMLECVILRGVKDKALNPAGMSFDEIAAFARQRGIELSDRTMRRVFDELKKVFLSVTDIGIVDNSVSLNDNNSPRKAGRPVQRWKLNDHQTAKTALAREITKKVMERHFTLSDEVIAPLDVLKAALIDLDLPHDDSAISSLELALETIGELDKTTARKLIAEAVADRLTSSLDDYRGEPIPDDFPMKTGEDYLAAHGALRLKVYQGNVHLTQKQIASELGFTSAKVAARVMRRIGVPVTPSHIQEVTLTRDRRIYEQVESVRSKVKGKALSLKAVRRDGTIIRENYSIAAAQRLMNEGAAVTVAIRTANMYSVTPDIRPIEAAPRVVKPAQQQQEQPPAPRVVKPAPAIERDDPDHIGHSRVWLRDQLALILSKSDRFEVRGDNLISLETGEITSRNAPVSALLSLLIGREIQAVEDVDFGTDELFAFALREWGDNVQGVKLG